MTTYLKNIFLKKCLLPALLLICSCGIVSAQQNNLNMAIDSLIIRLPAMMRSNEKTARKMIDELTLQSEQQQHRHGVIQSVFFKAWLSYRHNTADVAINSIDSAFKNLEGINTDTALIKFYILKGQCFVKKALFSKALDNFKEALRIAEKRNDQVSKASTMISIGWAYMEDGKPNEAIRFFNEVLQLNPSANYENRAVLLCNIASCYNTTGNFTQAQLYAQQGVATARRNERSMEVANGLNILARSYYQQGKLKKAISFLKEAAVERAKISDPSMLASDYLELADLYNKNGQPAEAIAWAKKAETLSLQHANRLKLADAYQALATSYEGLSDYKNASVYLNKLLVHKDSLANDHYNQAFAQMQVQFETQKKTAEILLLKKDNLEATLRSSNQQRWLLLLAAGILLLVASGIYISKLMKSRYSTRLALEQLSEQKMRTMAVMEAEEKERRRIAGELHDGVGQTLVAASMQLNKARTGNLTLDKVDELISRAGIEVRNLSHQVTPELLLHYGLVKAMEEAVHQLNDANDKTIFTLFTYLEKSLEDEMASLTLFRCFQELSTNILKHAQADKVVVQLNMLSEEAQLIVEDNGVGFEPGKAMYGLGIKNMESRISFYEGELLVDSTPGKGTSVIVKIRTGNFVNGINKKTAGWKK